MFNSSLIGISTELNGGTYRDDQPLVKACREFHIDIIRVELEMWQDQDGSDESFKERFAEDFPTGFLRRDLQRAKNVIYDLYDIAISEKIRFQLTPIYTYVMYQLIKGWFATWENDYEMLKVPRGLKTYLRKKHASKEMTDTVISWFTDGDFCTEDFINRYNGDYVSVDFAEEIAGMYLDDKQGDVKLEILGVTIDEFFDLLPNDLRDRCMKKYSDEKYRVVYPKSINKEDYTLKSTVFISYSWDSTAHKEWVKKLSDRLESDGIHTIFDQKDLVLGDPLPQFMEQSIVNSNYVLIICTPIYKKKADARKGGVGYEESIIASDVFINQNHRKYITVLASGTWGESTPIWAGGKYGADLSDSPLNEDEYDKLVRTISKTDSFFLS